ncbi:MAG: hypothetical protein LBJ64_00185 [Deltaproteobacteria bacterium]|nr:hypothetical protein [Deltaproteobacteria bacterium]
MSPPEPIKTGPGGPPRILSLAAEKSKEWFCHPDKCPALNTHPARQTRSERRKACQIVIEAVLKRLDLASLCIGVPTPANGFINVDMKTIVAETGLGQRRCERPIGVLKEAGFLNVKQPRCLNAEGAYIGLRAIRVFTEKFFDWLGLLPMLKKKRERASLTLRRRATRLGKPVSDLIGRVAKIFKPITKLPKRPPMDVEKVRAWNRALTDLWKRGIEGQEAQRPTNQQFCYPLDWSPGKGALGVNQSATGRNYEL